MERPKFSEVQLAFILHQAEEGTAVAELYRQEEIVQKFDYCWSKVQ